MKNPYEHGEKVKPETWLLNTIFINIHFRSPTEIMRFFSQIISEMKGSYTLKVHMTGFLNCILVLGFFIKLKILNKMKTSSKWTNTQEVPQSLV